MAAGDDSTSPTTESDDYFERLAAVVESARSAGPLDKAVALREAQRVAAWGLREAVTLARESSGLTWRELADVLDIPPASLHRRYQSGRGLLQVEEMAPLLSTPPHLSAPPALSTPPAVEPAGVGTVEGGPEGDRPTTLLPARPLNLFIGRDTELADLGALLRRHRVLTITGPAGVGKTRLAIETAHRTTAQFRGGVYWIPLAGAPSEADAALLTALATQHLRSGDGRIRPLEQLLASAAAEGPVLLAVDNCEHVLGGCADLVQRLLARHPNLTVLATSRETLELPGEVQVRLVPFPRASTDPADAGVLVSPAVRLFSDRARLAAHDVSLAGHESVMADICNRLDGLPLAIELAAKQCALLPVTSLPDQLERQLDLATARPGAVLGPHTGLRVAIGWSFDLLDPVEKALFRRLAILPDGVEPLTAAALSDGLGLSRSGVWAVLGRLAAKSMLTAPDPQTQRFGMLAAIREYGREQLSAAGEEKVARELLLSWFTSQSQRLLDECFVRSDTPLYKWALSELSAARVATGMAQADGDPRYPTLALATALSTNRSGEAEQARGMFMSLVAEKRLLPEVEALNRANLSASHMVLGDYAAALEQALLGRRIALDGCGPLTRFQTTMQLRIALNDPAKAIELGREQVAELRELGLRALLPNAIGRLAWDLLVSGQVTEAADAAADMLAIMGDEADANQLETAGLAALELGDIDTARRHFRSGLARNRNPLLRVQLVEALAAVAVHQDRPGHALRLFAGATTLRARHGYFIRPWIGPRLADLREKALQQVSPREAAAAETAGTGLGIEELARLALDEENAEESGQDAATPLTEREMTITALVAGGYTTKQIAARLHLAPSTISNRLAQIRTKLGLPNRSALAAWAAAYHPDLTRLGPGGKE